MNLFDLIDPPLQDYTCVWYDLIRYTMFCWPGCIAAVLLEGAMVKGSKHQGRKQLVYSTWNRPSPERYKALIFQDYPWWWCRQCVKSGEAEYTSWLSCSLSVCSCWTLCWTRLTGRPFLSLGVRPVCPVSGFKVVATSAIRSGQRRGLHQIQ